MTFTDLPAVASGSQAAKFNTLETSLAGAAPGYSTQAWADLPTVAPGSRATRLNHLEAGIAAADSGYSQQTHIDLPTVAAGSRAARLNHIETGIAGITGGGGSTAPEVAISYLTKANGAHPSTMDTGQPVRLTYNPSSVSPGPIISGGRCIITFTGAQAAAGYVTAPVAGGVEQAWASWNWGTGASNGTFGLLLWENNMPNGVLTLFTQYSICHMAFTATNWQFGQWRNAPVNIVHTHTYDTPITDGRTQTCYLKRDPDDRNTIYVTGPDGVEVAVTNSYISTHAANYICAEHYFNNASTNLRPLIQSFSATATPYVPPPDIIGPYEFHEEREYDAAGGTRDLAPDDFTQRTSGGTYFLVDYNGIYNNTSVSRPLNTYYNDIVPTDITRMYCSVEIAVLPSSGHPFGPSATFVQSASPFKGIYCQAYDLKSWRIVWGVTGASDTTYTNVLASGTLPTDHQVGDRLRALWDQSTKLIKLWRIRGGVAEECGEATYPGTDQAGFNRTGLGLARDTSGKIAAFRSGTWT